MPALVISLDFELFWGVTDSRSVEFYGPRIQSEWHTVPAILALFEQYGVHATWATVGMLLCKNYAQWYDVRPAILPTYERKNCSTYTASVLARDFPDLFFARPLVNRIVATDGQELASHSYSHFYCSEAGATVEQFVADLACNRTIFDEYGVKPTSFVFPRNQVVDDYLDVLPDAGFTAYRGNEDHWVYRDGHAVPYGTAGRLVRVADAYLPLTGNHVSQIPLNVPRTGLVNIPASRFLRPSTGSPTIDRLHIGRVKRGMLEAARTDGIFHLWWHPYNFGLLPEANLLNLESILKYYRWLQQKYGMRSQSMKELVPACR